MDDETPSPVEDTSLGKDHPHNVFSDPSAYLAPSDFLPGLAPSTKTPSDGLGNALGTAEDGTLELSGNAVPTRSQVDSQGRKLNPRSCVTCRKRKVRCDKIHPCTNCNRAHIECVFPAPGRAPRKTRKLADGRDKELLERLRRLEGVVKGLGVEVPGQEKDENRDEDDQSDTEQRHQSGVADSNSATQPERNGIDDSDAFRNREQRFRSKTQWIDNERKGKFENRFGRLVVNEGKSRYINNSFWANLSGEVEDLKGILNQSSDEEDAFENSPNGAQQQIPSNHHGFVFGYSSQNVELINLHPIPSQIQNYWEVFKDRVDPLLKLLHIPTLEPTILSATSHLANLSRGFECLLFAIYYAAVTSLSTSDCFVKFREEKSVLLARYRFAIEQALARANFLTTEELVVLQGFVIFLICLRRNSDARVIWTLTGLVVRIAQTIGIHRDGSHFNLTPFEAEMRRRLWWQVCILDTRASEDHGCDPTIVEQSFDTNMPLNINDVDISPEMKTYPPERVGCTDMSFCLLRCEVANTFRRINYIPPGPPKACTEFLTSVTLEDKERWITECHQKLEERYLNHCDMSVPLYWVTATVARLMMSKMWLMVYHPFQRIDGGARLSDEMREKLFITSLENLEYSLLLETEARTMKWGWLFKTYMQWHALAFLLSELCHRMTGDMVERAWTAVEKTRDGRWGVTITDESNTGHLWRPLKKLYRKAQDARQRGLQEEQLQKQRPTNPPTRTYSPNANPMFGHPQRPRVTRAPLSSAQLQRFSEGPTYGQTPLDKHDLLRTPSLSDTGSDRNPPAMAQDMDHFRTTSQKTQNPNGHVFASANNGMNPDPPSVQDLLAVGPGFGQSFLSNTGEIDFNNFSADPTSMRNRPLTPPIPTNNDGSMRLDSLDTLDGDLPVMDTSGDMNWENWDHLVRQFGMEDDSFAPGAHGGNHLNWNGSGWDNTNGANMRLGFGMNGGDLF